MNMPLLLDVKKFAIHDGPGIRTSFFTKGCPLHCLWCHNPESISPRPQIACFDHKCVSCGRCEHVCSNGVHKFVNGVHVLNQTECKACGECEEGCFGQAIKLYGKPMSVDEVVRIALADKDFYDASGGGVTISGGEPLLHPEFVRDVFGQLKEKNVHTACDTCLFVERKAIETVLDVTDMWLADFKCFDSDTHHRLTGQPNEKIKSNLKFLSDAGRRIEIRIPFVPGYNGTDDNMEKTGAFLRTLKIDGVRLLPYHSMARTKYGALRIPDTMPDVEPPSAEVLDKARAILQSHGLRVLT